MDIWAGIQGAATWLTSPKVGDDVARDRLRICNGCDSMTWGRVIGIGYAATCGELSKPNDRECGCLIAVAAPQDQKPTRAELTISGRPYGKLECDGQRCPQRKW